MTKEFVTLSREVLEQALNALDAGVKISPNSVLHDRLRAALDQPQNHVSDAGNMVPAGWKLVPVEPTQEMLAAACRDGADLNGRPVWKHTVDVQAAWRWGQMLAAAPQPPTVKHSSAVEQQQVEQEPVAKVVLTEMLGLPCLQWLDLDRQFDFKGGELLYTHPQPKREPLTDEEIDKLCPQFDDPMRREMWIIGFKAAHNIK